MELLGEVSLGMSRLESGCSTNMMMVIIIIIIIIIFLQSKLHSSCNMLLINKNWLSAKPLSSPCGLAEDSSRL
jgi:hypothetical protein